MSSCPSCGADLAGEWKFCLQCGQRLGEAGSDGTSASVDVPAAIRPADAASTAVPMNLLAVIAFVLGIIGGPIAAVFGHLAINQIRRTGERGMVLARIATVLGYVWLALWLAVIAWIVVVGVG